MRRIGIITLSLLLVPAAALGGTREAAKKVREGIAHFGSGDYQEAGKAFAEADVARPDDRWIAFDRACVYAAQGDVDKAEDLFQQAALSRDQRLAVRSHYNLGSLAAQKARAVFGDTPQEASPEARAKGLSLLAEAVGHYRDCLDLDPSHADARHNLEVIRLWIKHMQAIWQERDRQKQRDEMGLLEFLQMIEAQQRALRAAARALAGRPDSPQRRQALAEAESSQRKLAEEIEPLKDKIKAELEPAQQPPQPGGQTPGPQAAADLPPEALKKAVEALSGLADEARRAMNSAADMLHGGSVTGAADWQAEAVSGLDEIYKVVVPFPSLVQRSIAAQQGLVDQVAPAVENPDEQEGLDCGESAWGQRFVAGWADLLALKAEQGLEGLESFDPGALAAAPGTAGQPGAPDPEAMKEQMEGLEKSMEKAVELGPKIHALADEAAGHLEEKNPAEALPKQEEALKLLKQIVDEMPKQDQQQQGDQQKDQQQDEQKDQQQSGEGQKQPRQKPRPQDLSRQQAEAVLRKVRDRQRERRRMEKELQRYMYRPGAVEKDW